MKRFTAIATLVLCASIAQAQPYQTWNRYREIAVNTTASGGGANVAGTVANFPLLVRLSNTGGAATGANVLAEALAGGADVRFTDSTGMNALSYQIENWSAASAAIWVKVPSVPGNALTKIRMYWGRSGQTSLSSGSAVFDTSNGYTAVWHLNENGAVSVEDATANALHFTGNAQVPAVEGVSGRARYYNQGMGGGAEFYVDERANHPKFYAAGAATQMTISAWVNRRADGSSASQAVFGQFRYSAGGYRSYALMYQPTGEFSVLTSVQGTGDTRRVITSGQFPGNQWHHVVARINSPGPAPVITFYVNGVLQTTTGTNTTGANAAVFASTSVDAMPLIGALERAFNQNLEAFIDEIQFSNGTLRDSNWIQLTYQTQKPGATAVTLGATQSVATRPLFYPQKVAVYLLNSAITSNVPVTSGTVTGNFAISPSTLPAGLTFTASTGAISGTPTALASAASYIVTATVGGSPASDTITVSVSAGDPPGAPAGVTAVRGNAQATVSWTAPVSAGSSAITGYLARATQDTTKTCAWTTGPLTCTITGLTNGTSYTFVVRASSAAGNSPFSAASAAVIPSTVPGAPTNVVATVTSATSVAVTWTAPTSNGGSTITDYYVTSVPGGLQCYSAPIASPTCTVSGLTTGTAYTFTVVAANVAGNSAAGTSNSVTPTSVLPGSFSLRVTGSVEPYRFVLTPKAVASTEALTMSIRDAHGRTVWSRTVHPSKDGTRELVWNGRGYAGRTVSAGVYLVQVTAASGGQTADYVQRAVDLK